MENEESRTGAADAIRALVEATVLEPDGDQLKITLNAILEGGHTPARQQDVIREVLDWLDTYLGPITSR